MNKNIPVAQIYERLKSSYKLGVRQGRIYLKNGNNWECIRELELAIKVRGLFVETEQLNISVGAVKEVLERLLQDPSLQLHFIEEKTDKYVKLRDSVFDVESGNFASNCPGDFGYFLDFHYISENMHRNTTEFSKFVNSIFPDRTAEKRTLLLEILGYIISDYQCAKTAFFFIGESNSGKSTLLELIQRIFPASTVTNIPLYRLENRFNLARLADSKVNICTELSEKSFLAPDIFKMLTSNEIVTAEHKGCKPFEFRIRCKSVNAGNIIPDIKNIDGINAIINRMCILLFPVTIPKTEQDRNLLKKLWEERDSIFSEALDALISLRKRNFCFTEPADSQQLRNQLLSRGRSLETFITDCCVLEDRARIYLVDLFEAFTVYCNENLMDCPYSKMQFSQYFSRKPNITRKKMRINGHTPLSGLEGIRLKTTGEYYSQDSDSYSPGIKSITTHRNTGTSEQQNRK